jgi:ankyrin repeat protein
LAAQNDYLEVAQFLVNQQANVNTAKADGWTPLQLAASNRRLEMVKFLVNQRADINTRDIDGYSPFYSAAKNGHLEMVKFLVDQQADVNTRNNNGYTPLHSAVEGGHLEVVKFLASRRADVNTRSKTGYTALHMAAQNGHLEVVKFLVEADDGLRSEVNSPDTFGRSPLHIALYSGRIEEAKVLIEHGADVSVLDGYGNTALDWASTDDAIFHQLAKPSYVPTPESVRVETVRRSIRRLAENLLEIKRRKIYPGFYELGRCLLILQQVDEACISFQQQIVKLNEEVDPVHHVGCNICKKSYFSGPRFVCKVCPDVDLCSTCMPKDHNVEMGACHDHEFLEISWSSSDGHGPEAGDAISDDVQEWLREVLVRYGGPDSSCG